MDKNQRPLWNGKNDPCSNCCISTASTISLRSITDTSHCRRKIIHKWAISSSESCQRKDCVAHALSNQPPEGLQRRWHSDTTERGSAKGAPGEYSTTLLQVADNQAVNKQFLSWKRKSPFLWNLSFVDCCVASPAGPLIPFPPEHAAAIFHPSRLYLLMWKTQSLIKDAWERDISGR